MKKKLIGFSLKPIFRLLVAVGIIAFAAGIMAVSCGKTADPNNNNNNNANNSGGGNSGGDGNGGDNNLPPPVPTTNLTLVSSSRHVKTTADTVTLNAAVLGGAITPISDTDPNNRGFADGTDNVNNVDIFSIDYPGSIDGTTVVMYFVNRTSVSTNSITIPAASKTPCSSSESGDNALATAAKGGACRVYSATENWLEFQSYLGTVFDNTKTGTHARGTMRCSGLLIRQGTSGREIIGDGTVFNYYNNTTCRVAQVNNGLTSPVGIGDAWVGDSASVKEVELHVIGIDITGKTIEQFSGLKKADFDKGLDNAAFKKLLRNNKWGELKFKVRMVTAANF